VDAHQLLKNQIITLKVPYVTFIVSNNNELSSAKF